MINNVFIFLYRHLNFLLKLSLILLWACKPIPEETEPVNKPKPYVLDYPAFFGVPELPLENPLTEEGIELGRMLFYEKQLSADNSMSCASCHQQIKAFTDGLQVSKGVDGIGGTRNAMSLANLAWNQRFFWDGRAESLEKQALEPIQNPIELHQSLERTIDKLQRTSFYPEKFNKAFGSKRITEENMAKALSQFQRTLVSSNSPYDRFLEGKETLSEQEKSGKKLFFTHPEPTLPKRGGNCGDCHVNVLTSGRSEGFNGFANNGLEGDEVLEEGLQAITENIYDRGKFKVPTVRNIALTAPYMHDGRFETLEEVLDHYNEHIKFSETLDPLIIVASNEIYDNSEEIKLFLTEQEKKDIIAFLHALTDSSFITNPAFSNPFE